MLIDGVYSRDASHSPLPIKGAYEEDMRMEFYTKPDEYWRRMEEVSEQEEKDLGLRHYLKKADVGHNNVPYRLVIAVRGTKINSLHDIADDIAVGFHALPCSKRYRERLNLIKHILSVYFQHHGGQREEVCITGHSLGAAVALLAGKELAKDTSQRYDIHCFNPPLLSVPMIIKKFLGVNDGKDTLRQCPILKPFLKVMSGAKDLMKMPLVLLFGDHRQLWDELVHFAGLKDWMPTLYINMGDEFCKEYPRFYKWRHKLNIGIPSLPIHTLTLLLRTITQNAQYSCLVPSVKIVSTHTHGHSHDLKSWYTNPNLKLEVRSYEMFGRNFVTTFFKELRTTAWEDFGHYWFSSSGSFKTQGTST